MMRRFLTWLGRRLTHDHSLTYIEHTYVGVRPLTYTTNNAKEA